MQRLIGLCLAGALLFTAAACKKEQPADAPTKNITADDVHAFLKGENEALIDALQENAE